MKKSRSKTIRLLCVLMAVVMVVAVAPTVALANDETFTFGPWWGRLSEGEHTAPVTVSNTVSYESENVFRQEVVLTELEQRAYSSMQEEFGALFALVEIHRLQVNSPSELTIYRDTFFNPIQSYVNSPMIANLSFHESYPFVDFGLYSIGVGSSFTIPASAQVGDQFTVILAFSGDGVLGVLFSIEVVGSGTPTQQPTPTPAPTPAATPSTWAVAYIQRANDLNLVPANLNNSFTQATTRAEFAALAVTLYETVTGRTITERSTFNDTTDVNVQKMGGLGVVTGVGGGNFNPNGTITREQAAVLVARLADAIGQPFPPSAPTFADNADLSSWAVDGVGQMQASGIMGGVGNNNFSPSGDYTREQSIITMLRLFDILN